MQIRVKVVRQMLNSGIEQFGREHTGGAHARQRPPHRWRMHINQHHDHCQQQPQLCPQAALIAQRLAQARQSKAQTSIKRVILVVIRHALILATIRRRNSLPRSRLPFTLHGKSVRSGAADNHGNPVNQSRRIGLAILGCVALLGGWPAAGRADDFTLGDVLGDAKLYFTAPVRWDSADWLFFGGSLASIALAHDFDSRVRNHFAPPGAAGVTGADTNSSRDAIPAATVVVGTWLVAEFTDNSFGTTEAYTMLEAAGFSSITAEVFKYAAGRERPNETTDPNAWREGGSSFPSLHSTAAFAIGTVFAESGSDDYRWFRRVVGYGMATATAYLRVQGNNHWLSDTVAGAALGIATARFTTHRRLARAHDWNLSVAPAQYGGVQLTFNMIVD